jgi:hypothetical protein
MGIFALSNMHAKMSHSLLVPSKLCWSDRAAEVHNVVLPGLQGQGASE